MAEFRNPGLMEMAAAAAISAAMVLGVARVGSADWYQTAEPAPAVFTAGGEYGSGAVFQLADHRRDRRNHGRNFRDRGHDSDRGRDDRGHHGKQRRGRYAHIPEKCFKPGIYSATCDRLFKEADTPPDPRRKMRRYAHIPEKCFKPGIYSATCDRLIKEADSGRR
jgi:hypothetical protein